MNDVPPNVSKVNRGSTECDQYSHPAYGLITLVNSRGHSRALFGSDVGHPSTLRIEITRATLNRDLSRDWIHGTETVCEFEMSHSQFAEFITGVGQGSGTPVTFLRVPDAWPQRVPGIQKIETKHETFKREVEEAARERLDALAQQVARLEALIESGKTPKGELREITKELKRHVEQTPGSLRFVVAQAQEALEKATTDAKIEVESFIGMKAKQLGLDTIEQLGRLENKGENK